MKQGINKKHPRIKKVLKASAIVLSAAVLTSGVFTGVAAYQHKDYSSQSQIKEIASELNVEDMNVLTTNGQVKRLKYNDGEPIYVKISDDFNNEAKEGIQDSLDYVFGIVNPINDNYTYEIVSNDFKQKSNQTVISYELVEKDNDFRGQYNDTRDLSNIGSTIVGKSTTSTNQTIKINIDNGQNQNTYTHELLHAFGLADTYSLAGIEDYIMSDMIYKDLSFPTFMDSRNRNQTDITVSDYATLMSLYTKPFKSEEQKNLIIKKYKEKLSEYQDYLDSKKIQSLKQAQSSEPIELKNDYNLYTTFKINGEIILSNVSIHLDGDKYTLTSSYDNQVLETCEGNFDTFGNVVMLRNIKLKYGVDYDLRANGKQYQYEIVGDVCVGSYGNKDFLFINENNMLEKYNTEQKAIDSISFFKASQPER
jgi:hypothetical protein